MSRRDWREVSIDDIDFDTAELARQLIPTLRAKEVEKLTGSGEIGNLLVTDCRQYLSSVLPLSEEELTFLDLLNGRGEIDASLLTTDTVLQDRINRHPMLAWKTLNVRKYRGFS